MMLSLDFGLFDLANIIECTKYTYINVYMYTVCHSQGNAMVYIQYTLVYIFNYYRPQE